jgi:hypothetical protein
VEHGASTLAQGLIASWTFVAAAFAALGILVFVAIRNRSRPVNLDEALQAFRSLDIEAFRNLVDPAEEAFLRNSLSSKMFRKIKRQRAWAALIYAREAGRAATALTMIGQAAQRSSDAKIAAAGFQIAESAIQLRLQSVRVGRQLLTEILLPGLQGGSRLALLDQYERAAQTLHPLDGFTSALGLVSSKSA